MKTWMRRRGDRVTIATGKYKGHQGPIKSNVFRRTVDLPNERAKGHHVMLDSEELVTARCERSKANETRP